MAGAGGGHGVGTVGRRVTRRGPGGQAREEQPLLAAEVAEPGLLVDSALSLARSESGFTDLDLALEVRPGSASLLQTFTLIITDKGFGGGRGQKKTSLPDTLPRTEGTQGTLSCSVRRLPRYSLSGGGGYVSTQTAVAGGRRLGCSLGRQEQSWA